MDTNMSVTKWPVFVYRPDGHENLCNKLAPFRYRLDGHKNVRNKVAFLTGSMDAKMPVTKWHSFRYIGS